MKGLRSAAFTLALCGTAGSAGAHPVPFSYVDVRLQSNIVSASVAVHAFDVGHELGVDMERLLDPSGLQSTGARIQDLVTARLRIDAGRQTLTGGWSAPELLAQEQSFRLNARYDLPAPPGSVRVTARMFPYDPAHQTFVNVYEDGQLASQVILDPNRAEFEYFAGSPQGVLSVVRRFIPDGVRHILGGPDHLLFLAGLLLIGGTWRRLLLVASAFTIAHLITLSLAALDIFAPPARLIEPAIALTIVYVGLDNLLVRDGRDMRAWIALAFGFIHGFAFAVVLKAMDLPSRALGWSLFSFNIGVEIGQLLVVGLVGAALAALRARSAWAGHQLVRAGSVVVMAAGAFWFVQRVFFPGGIS